MASATHTLTENDTTTSIAYSLVGSNANGASYKNATRSLALPQTLDFSNSIGSPGSKGNDKLTITLKNSVENGTSGLVSTGSAKLIVSVPRDSAWTATDTADLLYQLHTLLDTAADNDSIADGIVP